MGEREKAEEWRIIYVFNGNISDIEFIVFKRKSYSSSSGAAIYLQEEKALPGRKEE